MIEFDNLKITRVNNNRYCIYLIWQGRKYRYYNGNAIGSSSAPNQLAVKHRLAAFESLLREFQVAVARGWTPEQFTAVRPTESSHGHILDQAVAHKLSRPYSEHYQRKIRWIATQLKQYLDGKPLTAKTAADFLNQSHWSPAMRNNLRSHYTSLEGSLKLFGYSGTAKTYVKRERVAEKMHRPFEDTAAILEEIKSFDRRLYLCCLLAYGCLLRPHREVRQLRWSEVSIDKQQIALSGDRTKAKRNRIVPIPPYVMNELKEWFWSKNDSDFVFSESGRPFAPDFFNGLWTKFKKKSCLLKPDQTIYSFRHTGAIRVFEKTGSIQTLQAVMGHSDLKVSLTYLRGLEVKQVTTRELPEL